MYIGVARTRKDSLSERDTRGVCRRGLTKSKMDLYILPTNLKKCINEGLMLDANYFLNTFINHRF